MAPTKLTYFGVRGLAEPIRFLLAYGKINYEDVRVDQAEWDKLKKSIFFEKLPVLEIDGVVLNQHLAICRYLGRKLNLAGKTNLEAAQVDAVVDTINDLRIYYYMAKLTKNEQEKAEKEANFLNTQAPHFLSKLDELVEKNGGHFVNGQLTWADIYVASLAELIEEFIPGSFEKYKNLKALKDKVRSIPEIEKWIASRPADKPH